jgi:chromosome segregation ATPase
MLGGNSARLEAVLRAGEAHRQAIATGDVPKGALKGAAAADALKKAGKSVKNINAATAIRKDDPGAAPKLPRGQSTPAAPQGFQMRKGGGAKPVKVDSETGNQIFAKSSEVVKDLISQYKKDQLERQEKLRKDRADAETCAQRRVAAINKYRDEEAEAARDTIAKLEAELKKVEKSRDDLQNASDQSLAKIDKMAQQEGESSKLVTELQRVVKELNAEKASVQDELNLKIKSCNEERDAAQREADAEKEKLVAAWQLKLDECEAKAAAGDVKSSKELAECTRKLEKAVEDLEAETKELGAAKSAAYEKDKKFYEAAKAACDALSAYTKESPDETFRKKTKDFVTSASAAGL